MPLLRNQGVIRNPLGLGTQVDPTGQGFSIPKNGLPVPKRYWHTIFLAGVTNERAKFACTLTVDHPSVPPYGATKCGGQSTSNAGLGEEWTREDGVAPVTRAQLPIKIPRTSFNLLFMGFPPKDVRHFDFEVKNAGIVLPEDCTLKNFWGFNGYAVLLALSGLKYAERSHSHRGFSPVNSGRVWRATVSTVFGGHR